MNTSISIRINVQEHVPLLLSFDFIPRETGEQVVESALAFQQKAPAKAGNVLKEAIRKHIKIKGYRDASTAKPAQLLKPVLAKVHSQLMRADAIGLASAVLRVWMEAHDEMRSKVADFLQTKNWRAMETDFREQHCYAGTLSEHDMDFLEDELATLHPDLDEDELALMLWLVSGCCRALPRMVETERFRGWLDELSELGPGAEEWREFQVFTDRVLEIGDRKQLEYIEAQWIVMKTAVESLSNEFTPELQYLGIETGGWVKAAFNAVSSPENCVDLTEAMREVLARYRPIRPQASSWAEEQERIEQRHKCEQAILALIGQWNELTKPPVDDAADGEDEDPVPDFEALQEELETLTTHHDELNQEYDKLHKAYQQLQGKNQRLDTDLQGARDALQEARDALQEAREGLKAEKKQLREQLRSETAELKKQLTRSEETEESWRQQYVRAIQGQRSDSADGDVDEPPTLNTLNDAISRAESVFSKELLFALNTKSRPERKSSPFQKPQEVFDALAWLATVYHAQRAHSNGTPDFENSIRKSCSGWSYSPHQGEVTMGHYKEWYETRFEGRTFKLSSHIGKGNSFDPKTTIRIAFDWDETTNRVVVGYIGRHQRNRQS